MLRNPSIFVVAVATSIIIIPGASAQWQPVNGPYGGIVQCLVVDSVGPGDLRLFAGTTTAGVFRSTDQGTSWSACNSGLTNLSISALAVGPGGRRLYAGTNGSGVFVSNDLGTTWMAIDSGFARNNVNSQYVESLGILTDPASDTIVIAGTFAGVYRSTNGGGNWSLSDSGFGYAGTEIDAILAVPDGSGGSIVIVGDRNNYAFISTDYGISWNLSNNGLNTNNVFCLTNVGSTIFAGTYNGMYKIGLHDASWTQVATGLPTGYNTWIYAIIASPDGSGGTNLVIGTSMGGFISADLGAHWAPLSNGLLNLIVTSLAPLGTNLVAGTYGAGMYRMSSSGSTWIESNAGLVASSVQTLAAVNQPGGGAVLYAGVYGAGLFSSTDGGATWIRDNVTQSGTPEQVGVYSFCSGLDSAGRQILYAGTGNGAYRSTDGGVNWSLGVGTSYGNVGSLAVRGTMAFGGGNYLSTNAGESWSVVGGGWGKGAVAILPSGANSVDLFAGPPPNGVLVSPDSGKNWNSASDNWHNLNPLAGIYWDVNVLGVFGTTLFAGTQAGVFVTANLGVSWNTVNAGLVDSAVHSFSTGSSVFAGANDGGIYLLTNFGTRWQSVNAGMPDAEVDALVESDPYLFAGTKGSGLWRRLMSEIVTSVLPAQDREAPHAYALGQNYPNPFNPSTNIGFQLPKKEYVSLKVYDILGRDIATLVSETREAGSYSEVWDARSCSSGMYFIRMQAGEFVGTRKVLLVK